MTVHLVDQHQVPAPDVERFVALVQEEVRPTMEDAGAAFVACDVAPELGDDIDVRTEWACADFAAWNDIRRNLMLDRRYHAFSAALVALRRGGTRRFFADEPHVVPRPDDRGPAIRRWEMFTLSPDASPATRERLRRAMRDCDHFIPGITRCAVGTNTSDGPIELVWETTYASVPAYASTYMTHPYHAALLDRFLLPDCPERVTTTNDFGAGLIGYSVEADRPLGAVAIRRLLLLDLDPARAKELTTAVAEAADGWSDSILAENTMSTRWFDAVTELGGTPAWSHVWDQCFATIEQYDAHRRGDTAAAAIEDDLVGRHAEVVYAPEST